MTVWTNGKAIRKYTGQDKAQYKVAKNEKYHHSEEEGWYKRVAVLMTEEEYQEYLKG